MYFLNWQKNYCYITYMRVVPRRKGEFIAIIDVLVFCLYSVSLNCTVLFISHFCYFFYQHQYVFSILFISC